MEPNPTWRLRPPPPERPVRQPSYHELRPRLSAEAERARRQAWDRRDFALVLYGVVLSLALLASGGALALMLHGLGAL